MLTDMQALYVQYRLAGKGRRESAILAGYSAKTAHITCSKLEHNPKIIKALAKGNHLKPVIVPTQTGDAEIAISVEPTAEQVEPKDPLDYLRVVMADPDAEPRLRLDAARTLAMYTYNKPTTNSKKTKKEMTADKAEQLKNRFASFAPPAIASNH